MAAAQEDIALICDTDLAAAGVRVVYSRLICERLRGSDPVGAIFVHAVNGSCETLAMALCPVEGLDLGRLGGLRGGSCFL